MVNAATLVGSWHEALNTGDTERLIALSHPDIEIVGPRGSAFGHAVLRDWLSRAGLTLEPQQLFIRQNVVVVAQHGVWRSSEAGEVMGEADVASVFRVEGGCITYLARYDTLDEALRQGGLSLDDLVSA